MNCYTEKLIKRLETDNWVEPTKEKFLSYTDANKRLPADSNIPYFEDIHYVWRNHKPNTI